MGFFSRHSNGSNSSWESILLDSLLFELSTPLRNQVLFTLSVFISFFLVLFQPFYLHNVSVSELLQASIGTGVIFFLVGCILNTLRAKGYWIFGKNPLLAELAYTLVFIVLVGLLVYVLRLNSEYVELSWGSLLQFQAFAFVMAIVPMFIGRLLTSLVRLQRDVNTRNELQRKSTIDIEGSQIALQLAGSEEPFLFPFEKWIAAKAAGNYVELYFNTPNHKPVVLLRTTLKTLVDAMQHEESFFQCHRSFVINIDYFSQLIGGSQAYKLELIGLASPVPVARNSEKQLLKKLKL